jgi:hypothetical protein
MPRISRQTSGRRHSPLQKCGVLRFVVVILSLISLISRIIYSTYASWLVFTTYDCIPCANSTSGNDSSQLFISQHSSAVLNTIRDLNIRNRNKRSLSNDSNVSLFALNSSVDHFLRENSSFISYEQQNGEDFYDEMQRMEDFGNTFIIQDLKQEQNLSDKTSTSDEWLRVFNSIDKNEGNDTNMTQISKKYENESNNTVIAKESQPLKNETQQNVWDNFDTNDFESNTMTIILNEQEFNVSRISLKDMDSESLNDYQMANDSSYVNSKNNSTKDDCSEECAVFLTVELNDPKIRKWGMILITSVLYLYALVMFCVFIGACFSFVEMLIIATFIEGAKLFTGFVLLIIDSFNGIKVLIKIIDFILKLKLIYAKLF